jgi:hypothetical protein
MNNTIRTFADYNIADTPIGYEAANIPEDDSNIVLGITQEDAAHFEERCEELDYDALREAEADDAWNNLRDMCNCC